jgi:hypothetical protein
MFLVNYLLNKTNVTFDGTDEASNFNFQVASLVSGLLADKFGRRHVTMLCILFLVKSKFYLEHKYLYFCLKPHFTYCVNCHI